MDLDSLADEYFTALALKDLNESHHKIRLIVKEIARNLPKDKLGNFEWFAAALKDSSKKWFVAKIIEKVSPVPKALLDDLVLAAMVEDNPSLNKLFIIPCVKTFGPKIVKERMVLFSDIPKVIEVNGFAQTEYWVTDANA